MATAKRDLTDPAVQGPASDPLDRTDGDSDYAIGSAPSRKEATGAAREIARRARAQQGLPEKIKDATTISRIATLLQPGDVE